MFLKYLGKTENFEYKGFDFSKGPAEVPDEIGKKFLEESPRSFLQVVPAASVKAPVAPIAATMEDVKAAAAKMAADKVKATAVKTDKNRS